MGTIIITPKTQGVIGSTKIEYNVAKGIVYFNTQGKIVETLLSNKQFETWVEVSPKTGSYTGKIKTYKGKEYEMAQMPKVIENKESISRDSVYYQQYDHEIAAFTLIYNRALEYDRKLLKEERIFKLSETKSLFTLPITNAVGLFFVGGGKYTVFPSPLDSTLVKAICMRESRCCIGQKVTDIMQVNNEGDWVKGKEAIGLKKGTKIEQAESIQKGILWLHTKSFGAKKYYVKNLKWNKGWDYSTAKIDNITIEKGKNAELNIYTCTNDWWTTVKKYNGSPKQDEYLKAVKEYFTKSKTPSNQDYYVDNKNYIKPHVPKSL